jgi:hypothetical protein
MIFSEVLTLDTSGLSPYFIGTLVTHRGHEWTLEDGCLDIVCTEPCTIRLMPPMAGSRRENAHVDRGPPAAPCARFKGRSESRVTGPCAEKSLESPSPHVTATVGSHSIAPRRSLLRLLPEHRAGQCLYVGHISVQISPQVDQFSVQINSKVSRRGLCPGVPPRLLRLTGFEHTTAYLFTQKRSKPIESRL